MLNFFLWVIGILSIISMLINHICDLYYLHPILMRINQFLMYTVACITLACMYVERYNEMICKIAILGFVISIIKSYLYYRTYKDLIDDYENQQSDDEEKSDDKNKGD